MEVQDASDWLNVYPIRIQDFLLYTKEKYNDAIIYITENGNNFLALINFITNVSHTCRVKYN